MISPAEAISVQTAEFNDLAARNHVRKVSEASGSSFLSGMRVLPPDRRDAMFEIYAFCREVDDIADDPLELHEKRRLLAEWREEIEHIFVGSPSKLTGLALSMAIDGYGLQKQDLLDLVDGMEMDADETATHGPSMEVLDTYCDRVASAVGRLSVRVFADSGQAAQQVATSLGRALQLTNILRDIAEDAERDRLYLPADLLDKFGIETRDPTEVMQHEALPSVCDALAEVALGHYEDATTAMAECSRRHMRPAILMMLVYRRVLDALMKRGWKDLEKPVKVSKATKLWILIRHGFF
ncbi:MAG: presqualene diphosphate synthase HpnD [Pseudomonadota bacterium]|nr:presqualene diphosphate synthase HpnD [Pseudomonadota bacterium]